MNSVVFQQVTSPEQEVSGESVESSGQGSLSGLPRQVASGAMVWVQTRFYVVLPEDRDRSMRLYWLHMAFQRSDFT